MNNHIYNLENLFKTYPDYDFCIGCELSEFQEFQKENKRYDIFITFNVCNTTWKILWTADLYPDYPIETFELALIYSIQRELTKNNFERELKK